MSARLRSRIISDGKYDKFGGFAVPHRASIVRCRCWPASDSCTPKGRFIITTARRAGELRRAPIRA
jgi:hypothetical protein